jgi:hypothetical protein
MGRFDRCGSSASVFAGVSEATADRYSIRGHHDRFRVLATPARRLFHPQLENPATMRDSGTSDGETRTRTGDTTIFSRAALAPESAAFAGDSVGSGDVAGVRAFPDFASVSPALRQTTRPLCLFVRAFHLPGATADPCDDFVVRGLASGDALDQAGVRLDVWWSPLQAVGVEEPRGEQKRRALVGVGQRVVLGEVFEQDRRLLDERGVRLGAAERRKGACSADSASVMRGSAATAARSAPSR